MTIYVRRIAWDLYFACGMAVLSVVRISHDKGFTTCASHAASLRSYWMLLSFCGLDGASDIRHHRWVWSLRGSNMLSYHIISLI